MVKTVLVVECQANLNWYEIFEGATLHGEEIKIEQAEWDDLTVVAYHDSGIVVSMRKAKNPLKGTSQEQDRTAQINFVLLRSVTRSIKGQDSRNKLFTLMHHNLPSVNSLMSAYVCLERTIVFGGLKSIRKRLGVDKFPLIDQTMYSSHRDMIIAPDFPLVGKVASVHAGYGKMRIKDGEEFQDFKSLCALHGDYVTVEPYIDWDWDGRVQKIGNHYRVFKRVSPNWKGNVGNMSVLEDIPLTDEYKLWIDECAKLFGGLDICALDFLHSQETGKEYILELNDTAIGLVHVHAHEDMCHIRDIVLLRMAQAFPPKKDQEDGEKEKEGEHKKKKKKGKDKEKVKDLEEEIALLKVEIERLKEDEKKGKEEPKKEGKKEDKKKKKGLFSK